MHHQRRTQGPQPDNSICADAVGLSHAEQLLTRAQFAPSPDQPPHLRGRQDFSRLGIPQEPTRPCQRVSYWQQACRGIARPDIHQHMAPVDRHAQLRRRPSLNRFRHQAPHRQRRLHHALRRLLQRLRDAEGDHDH